MTRRVLTIGASVDGPPPSDLLVLDHDDRWVRRKTICTRDGADILFDLPELRRLKHGDRIELDDGSQVGVIAADEALLAISGPDLTRYAWHIGNRHTPCAFDGDRLLVRDDSVLADMLRGLGASVTPVTAPFEPEGGAYGHGRVMGHDHAHGPHDHSHG